MSSEELTPSVFLHDLEEIKTIGEFACDFEVAIFSGPIDVDFKNKLFHMYRGTNNKIQCELFIKATDDEPQLKKGGSIKIEAIHVELRSGGAKLFLERNNYGILSKIVELKPFQELIKLKHLSF